MHYSVCVPAVFRNRKAQEALKEICDCDLTAFELWSWWDQDLEAIAAEQKKLGLKATAICTRFIPLNDPKQRDAYIEGLRESIVAAKKLQCGMLISQVGQDVGTDRSEQHRAIVEGLKACVPILEAEDMMLVIEPLNTLLDHRGYYLSSSLEGFDIVRAVGNHRIKLLFDIYHQQITEGNLIANITLGMDLIGHFHVAGVPGRHEPTANQEVNYPAVVSQIKALGYDRAIGLEYFPTGRAGDSLRAVIDYLP